MGSGSIGFWIDEVVFANENIGVCIIDPNPENTAAIRAYEKVASSTSSPQKPRRARGIS